MATITKDMTISDVLQKDVDSAMVFFEAGMHCVGCPSAAGETIEEASAVHGIDADDLVDKLNKYFSDKETVKI
jgi:hybrid cluster-associated redox disulfide protein